MGLSPQQIKFKEGYLDPGSPTFGNAVQSAIAAGYSEKYAQSITRSENQWVLEIVRDYKRLQSAETALSEALAIDTTGDTSLWKYRLDAAKFVAKGMAKHKYSERTEHTGPDGKELPTPILMGVKEEE